MGLRSIGLGHAFRAVDDAAIAALKKGINYSRPSLFEPQLADRLVHLIPSFEMVKFGKNGSDATSAAVKLARAATGRDVVAICRSHPFFSTGDWFIGSTPMNAGIPQVVRDLTVSFTYNEPDSLQTLFDSHPGAIACVVMEVEKEIRPRPGFLEAVRSMCDANGALLVFDEIITGFRHNLHGAQSEYGVCPDLAAFGKALGNGYSISALGGRREVMEAGGIDHDKERVFLLSTTYGAETHSLAAALATIEVYEKEPVIAVLHQQGQRLRQGIEQLASHFGIEDQFGVAGRDSNLVFFTRDRSGQPSQILRTLFMQEMIKGGIICPSFVVSYSHSDADIDHTIDAAEAALGVYARALDSDNAEHFVTGPIVKPVFRRKC
jgi:glutamate-1-semialdehyde 2,1-aminomutase